MTMQKKIVIFISFFIAHSFVISLCSKENRKTMSGQMVGGLGEAKQATAEEQIIVDSVGSLKYMFVVSKFSCANV